MVAYPRLTQVVGFVHALETAFARGPYEIGVPGDGSYHRLYGYAWLLILDKNDGALKLYQAVQDGHPWALGGNPNSAQWVYRFTFQVPHNTAEISHITLAFNRLGNPLVAYERYGFIYLLRLQGGSYITYGPYSGYDPVLVADATVAYFVPQSDVVLFYTDTYRRQILARSSRFNFSIVQQVASFNDGVYLDQAVSQPYKLYLIGSKPSSPMTTAYVLEALYDVWPTDNVVANAGDTGIEYILVLINTLAKDDLSVFGSVNEISEISGEERPNVSDEISASGLVAVVQDVPINVLYLASETVNAEASVQDVVNYR